MGWEGLGYNCLAWDRVTCRAVVSTWMDRLLPLKAGNFLTIWNLLVSQASPCSVECPLFVLFCFILFTSVLVDCSCLPVFFCLLLVCSCPPVYFCLLVFLPLFLCPFSLFLPSCIFLSLFSLFLPSCIFLSPFSLFLPSCIFLSPFSLFLPSCIFLPFSVSAFIFVSF